MCVNDSNIKFVGKKNFIIYPTTLLGESISYKNNNLQLLKFMKKQKSIANKPPFNKKKNKYNQLRVLTSFVTRTVYL